MAGHHRKQSSGGVSWGEGGGGERHHRDLSNASGGSSSSSWWQGGGGWNPYGYGNMNVNMNRRRRNTDDSVSDLGMMSAAHRRQQSNASGSGTGTGSGGSRRQNRYDDDVSQLDMASATGGYTQNFKSFASSSYASASSNTHTRRGGNDNHHGNDNDSSTYYSRGASSYGVLYAVDRDEQPVNCEHSPFRQTRACSMFFLFIGLILWLLLWGMATSKNNFYFHQADFAPFIVGKTRIIPSPQISWAHDTFSLHSMTADPGLNVYQISPKVPKQPAVCPPLTGPLGTLQDTKHVVLNGGADYQYAYFHLNQGSVISVDVQQLSGSTNIFLLQGPAELYALRMDDNEPTQHFSKLKWSAEYNSTLQFSYQVQHSDLYILYYENKAKLQSLSESELNISYRVDLTTHDLTGYQPRCTATESSSPDGCLWPLDSSKKKETLTYSCIVVQAVSISNNVTSDAVTQKTVEAHFKFSLRTDKLAFVSFLPLMVYLTWVAFGMGVDWCQRRCSEKSDSDDDNNDDDKVDPDHKAKQPTSNGDAKLKQQQKEQHEDTTTAATPERSPLLDTAFAPAAYHTSE
jgi:hypothetical protein